MLTAAPPKAAGPRTPGRCRLCHALLKRMPLAGPFRLSALWPGCKPCLIRARCAVQSAGSYCRRPWTHLALPPGSLHIACLASSRTWLGSSFLGLDRLALLLQLRQHLVLQPGTGICSCALCTRLVSSFACSVQLGIEWWRVLVLHHAARKADRAAADGADDCLLQGRCHTRQQGVCRILLLPQGWNVLMHHRSSSP